MLVVEELYRPIFEVVPWDGQNKLVLKNHLAVFGIDFDGLATILADVITCMQIGPMILHRGQL